ncbi:MAG: LysE family translocator [Minwuia sp.]|nr:LysE family translocator [Minwuia sp.]
MSESIIALIGFAVAATVSPGGATSLATASGIRFGYVRSLPLVLGMASSLAVLISVSALGLAAVILAVPSLALVMKIAGSAYLMWLAFLIGRAGAPGPKGGQVEQPFGAASGMMLTLVNPKAWAMALGVAGSFAGVASDPVALVIILATVFGGCGFIALSGWTLFGALLARVLKTQRQWQVVNGVLALMLIISIATFWI